MMIRSHLAICSALGGEAGHRRLKDDVFSDAPFPSLPDRFHSIENFFLAVEKNVMVGE